MDRDDDVDDDVSLLVVVLETNSQFWFPRSRKQQQETTTTTPSSRLDSVLGFDAGLSRIASIDPVFAIPYEALARTAVGNEGWRGLFGATRRKGKGKGGGGEN